MQLLIFLHVNIRLNMYRDWENKTKIFNNQKINDIEMDEDIKKYHDLIIETSKDLLETTKK